MFAMDQLFITYPDLRPYFYLGKEISEGDPNYARVLAIAEFLLDYFGSILIQHRRFPQIWPTNWWEPYFTHVFANSPILCWYLESTVDWYHEELVGLMKKAKAQRSGKGTQHAMAEEVVPSGVRESNETA